MTAPDSVPVSVWRFPEPAATCGFCYAGFRTPRPDQEEGVWRPLADDQRRDRIVRAAEAVDAAYQQPFGGMKLAKLMDEAITDLLAAVAAGRETT